MSDDDRMSLTTAISDDDEIEADEDGSQMAGNLNLHPHHANAPSDLQGQGTGAPGGGGYRVSGSKTTTSHHPSSGGFQGASGGLGVCTSNTASFNCTGAVRKAGFLSVKKWILRKKHQVWKHQLNSFLFPLCKIIIHLPGGQIDDPLVGERLFSFVLPSNSLVSVSDP